MSSLHILSQHSDASTEKILALLQAADCLILINNGVYACNSPQLTAFAKTHSVFALESDLQSRGLLSKCADNIQRCDYSQFVALCCEHHNSVSW